MLAFVDESYQPTTDPQIWHTTYAACCIRRNGSRQFSRELCNLKRKFWKIADPTEKELKGSLLLTERALQSPKNREFVQEILALLRLHEVALFAVTYKGKLASLKSCDLYLPQIFQFLIERVNNFTEKTDPASLAILVFDSIDDKSNRVIAQNVTNFLYKHGRGKEFEHVLDFPAFGHSLTTPGLQIADLAAYCANSKCGGRRDYLEGIYVEMKAMTHNWQDLRGDGVTDWGFRFMDSTGGITVTSIGV